MLQVTNKRLTRIFTSVIVAFILLIGAASFLFLHLSLMRGLKNHIIDDIKIEFMPYFQAKDFNAINSLREDEPFQVLDRNGNIAASTYKSADLAPALNKKLLENAFSGITDFETLKIHDKEYLISYFYLDNQYAGRVIMSLEILKHYEIYSIKLMLVALPFMLLLAYIVSRYLVNHAMKPISEVFKFQETFSSNVLHELRSPLASLKGNIEVSLRKDRPLEEYKEVMAYNLKEVDRIINLLNNLYLLASSEFKPLDLLKDGADINLIVAQLLDAAMPAINAKGIKIEIFEKSGGSCLCDKGLIRRAIENILDNAVKYTPENGFIRLGISKTAQKVMVTVSNKANDLNKDEIAHLFDPFYRGKNSIDTKTEGMGLGLYIANYIVRSHNGDIKVNADNNLFSVTISLPLK